MIDFVEQIANLLQVQDSILHYNGLQERTMIHLTGEDLTIEQVKVNYDWFCRANC